MSGAGSLLEVVAGLLERTYRVRGRPGDLGSFVIGDRGLRQLFETTDAARGPGSASGTGARTLVRETPDGPRACIYFPDALIRRLERYPPQRGLGVENVDAFAAFVEEIDHLLVLAERSSERRQVSLFELELHANVSKHLVLTRFLGRLPGRRPDPGERLWLRHRLFTGLRYTDDDPAVRARYRESARWAVRLIDALARRAPQARLAHLRQFHAAGAGEKLALIERLAA